MPDSLVIELNRSNWIPPENCGNSISTNYGYLVFGNIC